MNSTAKSGIQKVFAIMIFLLSGLLGESGAITTLWATGGASAKAYAGSSGAPRGGTLRLRKDSEPATLNPIIADGYEAVDIQFYVMEALLLQNEHSGEWQPWLADRWTISEDGMSYTFHIREDAVWSDGTPVTSADVKFSLDVIFNDEYPTAHLRPYYESIKNVEALDNKTVRYHTKAPYFGNFISAAGLPIVPKHIYGDPKKGPKIHNTLVGSGPYKVKKWKSARSIELVKNPLWWGKRDPLYKYKFPPERVVFQFVGDDNMAFEMIRKGELDQSYLGLASYLQFKEIDQTGNLQFQKVENLYPKSVTSIALNMQHPFFQSVKVRKALAHLVDRKTIIEKFYRGVMGRATGPWYKQSDFADPSVESLSFSPKKALQMLREEGWEDLDGDRILEKVIDGTQYEFEFTVVTADKNAELFLTVLKEDAKKAGVVVNIKYVEWNSLSKLLDEDSFDAVFTTHSGGLVDFDPKPGWHSLSAGVGGRNYSNYSNPKVDRLIEKALTIYKHNERVPVMRELYRTIAQDSPHIFLFNDRFNFYMHSNRVGFEKPTLNYDIGLKFWWVKSSPEEKKETRIGHFRK